MNRRSLPNLVVAALLFTACGGSSSAPSGASIPAAQAIVVATAPLEASVQPGQSVKFTARVTGTADPSVTWSVDEADGGSVDSAGLYTAPAVEGTFHVRAESASAAGSAAPAASTASLGPTTLSKKGGTASVVRVGKGGAAQAVAVSLSPATATLDACKGQVFAATVTGASNTNVTWTVGEAGGGSVTNGIYTAPEVPGIYTVTATSVSDPTKTAQATITVGPEKVLAVAVAPGAGAALPNGTLALAATLTTSCGTFPAQ
jgi:hypothetical protein